MTLDALASVIKPDPVSVVGDVLKEYIIPAGISGLMIFVLICVLLGVAGMFGVVRFGRALKRAIVWQPRRTTEQLVREVRAGAVLNSSDYEQLVRFDSVGFTLAAGRDVKRPFKVVRWEEVRRIVAFKRELFRCDCICLFFTLHDDAAVELNEAVEGWSNFAEAMPTFLPGCEPSSGWMDEVVLPRNAAEGRTVYVRTFSQ